MRYIITLSLSTLIIILSGCGRTYPNGTPATMKAYCVRGKTYHPTYVSIGKKSRGIASWYGPGFHSKRTSNGEIYNMYDKTAAHKTWPMNTMVKITNLSNHRSVIVRINDRGPFVRGRIIDCSFVAGKIIGINLRGTARVQLEVVGFGGKIYKKKSIKQKIPKKVKITNFAIKIKSFKDKEEAIIYQRHYSILDKRYKSIIKKVHNSDGDEMYLVLVIGFKTNQEAEDYKYCNDIKDAIIIRE